MELYHNQEWEDLQKVSPIEAVGNARQMGVPQEAVDAFIDKVVAEERGKGDFYFLYRFMKYAGGGTQEEIRAVGEKVYDASLQSGNFGAAMEIAGDLYGEESEQWKRARALSERAMRGEESEKRITLNRESTFADLAHEITRMEDEAGWEEFIFDTEMQDNFPSEVAKEVSTLLIRGSGQKVLDFFKERGYSQRYLSSHLPVRFQRRKK